ncbi:MAG: hypothetical protein WCW87_01735 [Candidatus Paceibacterota bacterium]
MSNHKNILIGAPFVFILGVLLAVSVSVVSATSIGTNITSTGDTTVGGNLSVTGTSALTGDVTLTGALAVTGDSTLTGILTVNGAATSTLAGNAAIGNSITDSLNVMASTTLASTTIGTYGATISSHLSAVKAVTFTTAAGASCTIGTTMTILGARDGDTVTVGMPTAIATASTTITWSGYVSANDTVSVRLCHGFATTTSTVYVGNVRADVWRH